MTDQKDPWLLPWLALVHERAGGAPVLELGCGSGRDTATLVQAGCNVVGVDLSASAIAQARQAVPQAQLYAMDIQASFPLAQAGVVLASLSLHYFTWPDTQALVERIRSTLTPHGLLLCRLNSTNDHHYGASGHSKIEENYYLVDGEPKRFFDRKSVDKLFAKGWRVLSVAEHVIDRYTLPKAAWEVVLEKLPE
jgi:trans-aconitate methyltransferase